MMQNELTALLKEIPAPDAEGLTGLTFSALPIPEFEQHRLARNLAGDPALLIAVGTTAMADRTRPPPIQLEHITVQHEVTCRVRHPDGQSQQAPFTVIQFLGPDIHLRGYFLRLAWSLLVSLGQSPTAQEVQRAVHAFAELFRSIAKPARRSVQGVWAELFVLARATDPIAMAEAWHVSPEDRYDFHGGQDRVEVKSTVGRVRKHRFSLEQLQPPVGTQLMIASILLEQSSGGVSLHDLMDRVHLRLKAAAELQGHIDRVMAETLGDSLPRALAVRFDWELACETLAFYPHKDVPTLHAPLPPELTEISFIANLTALNRADPPMTDSGLFAAAWPLTSL
jgi:hypothetical protein